jgi:hypothetical protein
MRLQDTPGFVILAGPDVHQRTWRRRKTPVPGKPLHSSETTEVANRPGLPA